MSWDMYWHGDPEAARFYREADRLSLQRADFVAWLQGRYAYDAICATSPILRAFSKAKKPAKYTAEPYLAKTPEEREKAEREQAIENGRRAAMDVARWVDSFNAAHADEGAAGNAPNPEKTE